MNYIEEIFKNLLEKINEGRSREEVLLEIEKIKCLLQKKNVDKS